MSNNSVDWQDLPTSFCFNLELIKIINLLIWFTPRKMRCICSFFALKSQVNITFIIYTRKDFFCSCKIGINSNIKVAFLFQATIQKLPKPIQILTIFTNRYLEILLADLEACLCHLLTQHHKLEQFLHYTSQKKKKKKES